MNWREKSDNRINRSIALLSLAHGDKADAGPCPSPEELAVMIEGKLRREQKKKLQHHLGLCAPCYQRWLVLAASPKASELRQLPRAFNPRRVFGYLGTTLAAAASIALYLNLTSTGVKEPAVLLHKDEGRPQISDKADVAEPQVLEKRRELTPAPPVAGGKGGDTGIKARSLSQPRQTASRQSQETKLKVTEEEDHIQPPEAPMPRAAPPPSAAPAAERANSAAMDAELMLDKKSMGRQASSFAGWRGRVELLCGKMERNRSEWRMIYDEGRNMAVRDQTASPDEKSQLSRILEKIEKIMATGATGPYCREIHEDLASWPARK